MPDIRLESLRCVYSAGTPFEKVALDNIDLSIPAGQYAALLGHTGSGKSTLIQHLNGLLKPAAGRVLLGEEDIHRSKEALRTVRFRVGLVFQYPEYQLFEETVYRDIAFGPKNMGLNEQEVDEHVRFGAKFAGVDESLFEASPLDLSGGQKRRIAIAGVMAMKPEVLVLDEPMAGLDPAGCREIFGKGLHLLKGEKANPAFRIMYLSNMLESTLLLGRLSESEALLKQYDHLLDSLERKYNGEGKIFPVKRHRCLMSCYYCELYTMKGNSGKAQAYLDQATAYLDSSFGDRVEAQYLRTKSFYYWKEKDYRHALSAVNLALKINRDLDKLEMKKAILQSSGQLQEAVTIYEEIINKTETINTDAFDRQIEQLRVLNDLNDLEKQDRELKLKSEQEALKQKQIVVSIGLLLVLMGLLYMLWRIYMHTKRLRNELLQEKDSLIASEKQLRVVTKEAEAANKKKSAFIANISHEVRTPLNAIVGFSELLASSEYSEEEKIHTKLIAIGFYGINIKITFFIVIASLFHRSQWCLIFIQISHICNCSQNISGCCHHLVHDNFSFFHRHICHNSV